MNTQPGGNLELVVYEGDPDEGSKSIRAAELLANFEAFKGKVAFNGGAYGAVVLVKKKGRKETVPDPVVQLLTKLARSIPYLIDGEPETVLLSESEHGFLLEPSNEDVLISFFKGMDAYEPEEYLIEHESMPLLAFGEQVCNMGDQLLGIMKKVDQSLTENDDGKSLVEFLTAAKGAVKTLRLSNERGIRR